MGAISPFPFPVVFFSLLSHLSPPYNIQLGGPRRCCKLPTGMPYYGPIPAPRYIVVQLKPKVM